MNQIHSGRKYCLSFVVLIALLLAPLGALAQISVDKVIFSFHPGQPPVQNVVVRNSGTDALGVEIEPEEVQNPGTPEEKRVPTENLLASPKRISLPAGGQRTVRFLLKSPAKDKELIYRVKLNPKLQGFLPEEEQSSKSKETKIKVVTTVGLLVFALPEKPTVDIKTERIGNTVKFTNAGNTNVYIDEGKHCEDAENKQCKDIPAARIYAGGTATLPLTAGKKGTFRASSFEGYETIEVE